MKIYRAVPIIKLPQRGFSLLEVLVSLAVLSIGLLGLAALQTVGLRINHDSYQRTQATMLAYDIADRMRANSVGLAAGKYEVSALNTTTVNCVETACTTDQLADYDIKTWQDMLAFKLSTKPDPVAGTISAPNAVTQVRTIIITWFENDIRTQLSVDVQL